jgi:hypothetical protein
MDDYMIIETSTDNIVVYGRNKRKIRSLAYKLNKGCGFQGETPTFFLPFFLNSQNCNKKKINTAQHAYT